MCRFCDNNCSGEFCDNLCYEAYNAAMEEFQKEEAEESFLVDEDVP